MTTGVFWYLLPMCDTAPHSEFNYLYLTFPRREMIFECKNSARVIFHTRKTSIPALDYTIVIYFIGKG